ncbi:hypothetical protein LTR47_009047 [Exophiala xenobiotica]|nr:hypothetical protein LTR41_000102 [Exophiala xenobiotica]KAK5219472.1 hypothetical protein LTR72_007856 [Exophiala xenobiotica]KAK5226590.1 hypothetical protein LTR47_009047 [Exophiala xenobiotica]KAK5251538.1 hypothetical protein LTS06_003895 [Exophiala xenobiotica]KAK5260015.1 hypothetical protein LTR40_004908 [Exophiala xenobiotica]
MPHTSRSKKKNNNAPIQKRKEVLDEDGWTRITSSSHHPTASRRTTTATRESESAAGSDEPRIVFTWGIDGDDEDGQKDRLVTKTIYASPSRPMSPAQGTTLEKMEAQYKKIAAKFVETEYHAALRDVLARIVGAPPQNAAKSPSSGGAASADRTARTEKIETCVLFGSGSLSGDSVHWIDRHETAYYQVAAFKKAVEIITSAQGGHRPVCYAQEPDYNSADIGLLEMLGIKVVTHPEGFDVLRQHGRAGAKGKEDGDESGSGSGSGKLKVKAGGKGGNTTFAYSPAAELEVEYQIMYHNPTIWLHRSLDHLAFRQSRPLTSGNETFTKDEMEINVAMTDKFTQSRNYTKLPDVDHLKNFPFHGSVLWWSKDFEDEQELQ